jgi:glycosyltransferase involved in cell wall biosynthesis
MAYMSLARRRGKDLPPLVLVGPGSSWAQTAPGPVIRAMGYLPTREIRALMAASTALVLPSLEEGFGLPVVEAMAAGLPVICSHGSALEEVAGGAAMLVHPLDTRSIADGMERLFLDKALAKKNREAGLAQSLKFDWGTAARQTLEFYRRVLGKS